jgi:hypothetical protein
MVEPANLQIQIAIFGGSSYRTFSMPVGVEGIRYSGALLHKTVALQLRPNTFIMRLQTHFYLVQHAGILKGYNTHA